jgi:type I restriction enzyme S subunit
MLLGAVVRFGNGKAIKPGGEGRYPVYGSNGIIGGSDEFRHENGVIIGRVGAYCGAVLYCPDKFWASDNTLVAYPSNGDIDTKFLYYMLWDAKLSRYAGGAAQPLVTQTVLKQVEVRVPPLPVQQRIAGILSAYDELIENSQRRIKILESMARALYREWFVNFRFPGHENHPRVASPLGDIPQGWEATILGAHLAALESGKRPKGGIREEADGVPSIGAENINGIGRHEFASEKLVPREFFEQMRKGVVHDRDVAIYKDGAYIGKSSYFRDGFPHTECCVNEHVFLLRGEGVRLKQNFLYIWLQEPDTVQAIRSKNANAAQPGINQQTLGGLELVLPDEKTAAHFDHLVEPLLAEIISLAKRIQNLRRTRDLLLPRLLSGQINVEALA